MTNEKLTSGMARRARARLVFAAAAISVAAVADCSSASAMTAPIQSMLVAPPAFSTVTTEPARQTPQADSAGQALDELADAANEMFAVLETLLQELGSRESASKEEVSATRYLAVRYEDLGFSGDLQPFTIERISTENSGFSIETPV